MSDMMEYTARALLRSLPKKPHLFNRIKFNAGQEVTMHLLVTDLICRFWVLYKSISQSRKKYASLLFLSYALSWNLHHAVPDRFRNLDKHVRSKSSQMSDIWAHAFIPIIPSPGSITSAILHARLWAICGCKMVYFNKMRRAASIRKTLRVIRWLLMYICWIEFKNRAFLSIGRTGAMYPTSMVKSKDFSIELI